MGASPLYDEIGEGYANHRRPDPAISAMIVGALGLAQRVVSVGAGAGSYELGDRPVLAVEPSTVMIGQGIQRLPASRLEGRNCSTCSRMGSTAGCRCMQAPRFEQPGPGVPERSLLKPCGRYRTGTDDLLVVSQLL